MNLLSRAQPDFPPVDRALEDPNGLLAVGGQLDAEWLTMAYRRGIFPWFDNDRSPILWWCPDPRAVMVPTDIHISRSLAKRLRNARFEVTADTDFRGVITGCAEERATVSDDSAAGTWITPGMMAAYVDLHERGLAHSIEVWQGRGQARALVGGLYGVSLGRMFFGESMFSRVPDASKVALCHLARQLVRWGFWLIDCQIANPHLTRMGAVELPRKTFIELVEKNAHQPTLKGPWRLEPVPPERWTRSGTGT
ncbi:MAG: leucyl/phenylalanyl-tRNA--protein transferase [Gammaproteobacteria bacterium]|nr:MAG: leucyl/phenylalanyl-tRNA--protein transferase [Gammaproteobacteria bacterium]